MNKNVACQKIQKLWNTYLENGKNKLLKEILENPWKHTIHTCDIFDHYYPVLLEYWSLNIKGIRWEDYEKIQYFSIICCNIPARKIQKMWKKYYSIKKRSVLNIQEAWRKYRDTKESCPICMKIIGKDNCTTECGHRFCTSCLLKAVQINRSCPLCRKELVEIKSDEEVDDEYWYSQGYSHGYAQGRDAELNSQMREEVDDEYWYSQGYSHGYDHGQQRDAELNSQMREEIGIAKQQAYDDGIVTGRSIADDDLKLLRKKIEKLEQENILLKQKI